MQAADRQKFFAQLKRHEGTRRDADGAHIAYRDTLGKLTIGYGHNLDASPVPGLGPGSRLNEEQAERLLEADVARHRRELDAALPWAAALGPARYAALLNMAFNLGPSGLLGFKNALALMRKGNFSGAAQAMLASSWAAQVGRRALELAQQMQTGVWP